MLAPGAVHARPDEAAAQVSTSSGRRDAARRADRTRTRTGSALTKREPRCKRRAQQSVAQATGPPEPTDPKNDPRDNRPPRRPWTNAGRGSADATAGGAATTTDRAARHTRWTATATQARRTMSISPHPAPDTAAPARQVHPWKAHATRPPRPSRRRRHDGPTARPHAGLGCARPDAAPHDAGGEGRQPRREGPPRWRAGRAASGRRAAR